MRIGALAKESNLGVETLRFYERMGLLRARRSNNGYRVFDDDALDRTRFVLQARELGFTLAQIKGLLHLRLDPSADRGDVRAKTEDKVREIDLKILRLQGMRRALTALIEHCHGTGVAAQCPILAGIQDANLGAPGQTKAGKAPRTAKRVS